MLVCVSSPEPPATGKARLPRRVYGVGRDPEPRDSLANERTFLAWVRTSLALVAGAVAVSSPALGFPAAARLLLSLGLVVVAATAMGVGWNRWTRTEISMRTGGQPPGFTGGMVVLAAIGLLMAAALASSLLSH